MTPESVYNILVRKGVTATVRAFPDVNFTPATNTVHQGDVSEYSVKVVPPYKYVKEAYKQTTLITFGKGLTGVANHNLEFEVKTGLIIVINNREWTVVSVTPISDSSGIIMYTLGIES